MDAGEDRGTFVWHARIKWVQPGVTTAGLLSRTRNWRLTPGDAEGESCYAFPEDCFSVIESGCTASKSEPSLHS